MQTIPHIINGQRIADAERFGPVFNPSTGEQEKQVVLASGARVEEAIAAAKAALPGWRATSLARRSGMVQGVPMTGRRWAPTRCVHEGPFEHG